MFAPLSTERIPENPEVVESVVPRALFRRICYFPGINSGAIQSGVPTALENVIGMSD